MKSGLKDIHFLRVNSGKDVLLARFDYMLPFSPAYP